jgi:hypothetical protein
MAAPMLSLAPTPRAFARALLLASSVTCFATAASAQTAPAAESPKPATDTQDKPQPEEKPATAAKPAATAAEPAATASKPAAPPPPELVSAPPPRPAAPAVAASSANASSAKPEAEDESHPDDGLMGSHRDHLLGTIGMRVGYIAHEGLDPFSTNDVLSQFSLGVGSTVYGKDDLSFAALLLWDTGGTTADARGGEAKLFTHRLALGGEGRYHFFRRFYTYGRVAPGVVRWDASLSDASVGYERSAGNWMFSLDVCAGTAIEFAGEARGKSNRPRGWLSAEAGYGWTTASEVEFTSDEDNQVPARVEPLAFPDLALRGGFFRVAANLTY